MLHDLFHFVGLYCGSLIAGILLLVLILHLCGVAVATLIDWIDAFFERFRQLKTKKKAKKKAGK